MCQQVAAGHGLGCLGVTEGQLCPFGVSLELLQYEVFQPTVRSSSSAPSPRYPPRVPARSTEGSYWGSEVLGSRPTSARGLDEMVLSSA